MKFKKIWVLIPLILLYGCGDSDSGGSSSSFSEGNGDPVLNTIEVEDSTTRENLIIPVDGKDITISIKENTRDAFTLKATDKTNLTYYLTGKDIKDLGIDPKTGFVFFNLPTDYEKKSKYEIHVGVRDSVNNETEQKVIITVKDIKNEKELIQPIDVKSSLTEDEDKYFITTWKTDNFGISNDNQIIIPTVGDGYNYSVDWGDGTSSKNLTLDGKHTYDKADTYTIKIAGKFPRIYFGQNVDYNWDTFENDSRKILSINQWGTNVWESMGGAFVECVNLEGKASDKPNLSKVEDMSVMFAMTPFNENIGNWDTSNVTDMTGMFFGNPFFDQDISKWETSKVTSMSLMFSLAVEFNQNISQWDVSNVTNMRNMFWFAKSFNQNLEGWSLGSEVYISEIFTGADSMTTLPFWYSVEYDIRQRSFIVVVHNADAPSCKVGSIMENINGTHFGELLTFNKNISTFSLISSFKKGKDSSCEDYGREDQFVDCTVTDLTDHIEGIQGSSCVVGFHFEE
jgi:surface protein